MAYDYLVVLNRLRDKETVLEDLKLDEHKDKIFVASINEKSLYGLAFKEVVAAPNLNLDTDEKFNRYERLCCESEFEKQKR